MMQHSETEQVFCSVSSLHILIVLLGNTVVGDVEASISTEAKTSWRETALSS